MGELQTRRWQQVRDQRIAAAKADNEPCWYCKQPIDYDLPARNTDGSVNKDSATGDHIISRGNGGPVYDINNVAPAHWKCNSSRGAGNSAKGHNPSRDWAKHGAPPV